MVCPANESPFDEGSFRSGRRGPHRSLPALPEHRRQSRRTPLTRKVQKDTCSKQGRGRRGEIAALKRDLFEEEQYTFQVVEDGSLIQIYYNYNRRGDELLAARLAFYSTQTYDQKIIDDGLILPEVSLVTNDITDSGADGSVMLREEIMFDTIDSNDEGNIGDLEDKPISWLRIEYAPLDARGVLHHDCHMHISAFPTSRFIVAGVPNPKQFIEFIMALCYPEAYSKHRLNEDGCYINETEIRSVNSVCVPFAESSVFEQMPHFRIPFTSIGRRR